MRTTCDYPADGKAGRRVTPLRITGRRDQHDLASQDDGERTPANMGSVTPEASGRVLKPIRPIEQCDTRVGQEAAVWSVNTSNYPNGAN